MAILEHRLAACSETRDRGLLDTLVAVTNAIHVAKDRQSLFEAVESGCAIFGFEGFVLLHEANQRAAFVDVTNAEPAPLADLEQLGWWETTSHRSEAWRVADPGRGEQHLPRRLDTLIDNHMAQDLPAAQKSGPGAIRGFAIGHRVGEALLEGGVQAATIIGNAAMAKAEILGLCGETRPEAPSATKALSKVQHDVLSWIVEGKSNLDIATIVGLSERAVRYHVTEILRKLGVVSRAQAATIWRASGEDERNRR